MTWPMSRAGAASSDGMPSSSASHAQTSSRPESASLCAAQPQPFQRILSRSMLIPILASQIEGSRQNLEGRWQAAHAFAVGLNEDSATLRLRNGNGHNLA